MKRIVVVSAVLGLLSLASADYVENFDGGSANWNYGYGTSYTIGTTTWSATGGNPDAHISGASENLYAVWTYDTAAYGDMTGLTMTIDTKIDSSSSGNAQFYVGRDGTYYIDGVWSIAADTSWTTHTKALDSSNFSLWTGGGSGSASLAYVLAAPDDIGIFFGGNVASGSGDLAVDNFGVIPEPATTGLVVLFGGGVWGIRRFFRA